MSCLDGGGGGDGGVAGCGRRAGRAGRRRPSPYPLLAGAVHPQSLLVRGYQGPGGGLAGARTAGPLRRGGPHGPGARRRPADGGERRRRGRPAVRHMDAEAGNRLVRRHTVHRGRRGLHRRILPARGGGLQRGLQLHRRDDAGGPRRPHRQDRVRRPQAVPLRAVRRHRLADPPEDPVRGLPRGRGLRGGEFPPRRHGTLQGRRVPRGRRYRTLGQRALPGAGQAGLRHRRLPGRRRRRFGRARSARDREGRLRLEPPDRAGGAGADGRRRQGDRPHRLRGARRAPGAQPDRCRRASRAGQAFALPGWRQPPSRPLRSGGTPGAVPRPRSPGAGRGRIRRGRPAHLQHPAGARGLCVHRQRCLSRPGHRRGEPPSRRGRLAAWCRRRAREGRRAPLAPLPDLHQRGAPGDSGPDPGDVDAHRGGDDAARHRRGGVLRRRPGAPRHAREILCRRADVRR